MNFLEAKKLQIGERQRKEFKQPEIDQLKRSILSKGLLHPPVVTNENELIAGERRVRAITQLYEEGLHFECDGQPVPFGFIPILHISDLTSADLQEAELEENILRVPLSMLEEVEAKAKIHQLRCEQNPKQTVMDTAREIIKAKGQEQTLQAAKNEQKILAESLIIMQHRDDPRVQRAKTRPEAFREILAKREVQFQAQLSKHEKNINHSHQLIHGDCLTELPKLGSSQAAAIICDPPYGIKADKQGKESKHYYDDSPETALKIYETIIREGFRICRSRAVMFLFCDQEHFLTLREYARQQAWTVWPKMLIWDKRGGQGHAPWGKAGFRRTYETILFAVKGQDNLTRFGGDDILSARGISRDERVHAAEKPVGFLSHLVDLACLPGELILDPCCGSGPIISAAKKRSCRTICIERDETSYAEALSRLSAKEELTEEEAVAAVLES